MLLRALVDTQLIAVTPLRGARRLAGGTNSAIAMNCPSCASWTAEHERVCASCAALSARVDAVEGADRAQRPGPCSEATTIRARADERARPRPAEPENPRFHPGAVLAGRYRIVQLLGRGGMGEVYRADDLKLDQPVALKTLPAALEEDEDRLACLLSEVKIARQVSHPNVCRIFDAGEADGHHFLSMEYIDGENLQSLQRRIGRLPSDKAVEIGAEIANGLAAVHEQGILHRDLKPTNLMIDGRGRARITDFGIAGLAGSIQGEVGVGTPAYMAPEQFSGEHVSARSDLYAFGLVLYELLAGQRAFGAGREMEAEPEPLSNLVTDLDPAVDRILRRCMERDPENRPSSSAEVAAALTEIAASHSSPADGRVDASPPDAPLPRRRFLRGLKGLGVALLLLLSATGIWTAATWPRPLGMVLAAVGALDLPAEPALPEEPSVVVLPFVNLSGDPEQEAFSDGLSEDVMTDLASIPDLFIIARGSAFSYKGRAVPVQTVGRELGVRYVVEGSVQRSGDQLRVTARLSDAATGFEIWRERYDRPAAGILALQSEISETLLGALHVGIDEAEIQRIRHAPSDPSAYEAFVRARLHYSRDSPEGILEARRWLEQALELDPDLAKAHSLLAQTHGYEHMMLWSLSDESLDRLGAASREAFARDPLDPEVLIAVSYHHLLEERFEEALEYADRAIEQSPSLSHAHLIRGGALNSLGRPFEGLRAVRRSIRLNPRAMSAATAALAWTQEALGRPEEAMEIWKRIRTAKPYDVRSRMKIALFHERAGRRAEAVQAVQEILAINPALTAELVVRAAFGLAEGAEQKIQLLQRAGLP